MVYSNKQTNDYRGQQEDNQIKHNGIENQPEKTQVHELTHSLTDRPQKTRQALVTRYFGEMVMNPSSAPDPHLKAIYLELNWWLQIVWCRYEDQEGKSDFKDLTGKKDFSSREILVPGLPTDSNYYQWLSTHELLDKGPERIFLATAMALSLNDALFLSFLEVLKHPLVTIFVGGQLQNQGRRFMPTMQTLFYLLGGIDLEKHSIYQRYFRAQQAQIPVWGIETVSMQTRLTGYTEATDEWKNLLISLKADIWQYFLGGAMPLPEDNQNLEITKLEAPLTFKDLILADRTKERLRPLITYAKNGQAFFKNTQLSKNFTPGYIALLHGPPGTGKTLIASTIGTHLGLTTYQLDVSKVVSKYIGETSKNINMVMDELTRTIKWLEGKPCILFIDEADSFMGKRSEVNDSKDRYANLDVSNLLQKFEQFPGLVILASNFEQNFDPAFKRRFKAQVHVPPPDVPERTQLWQMYLPEGMHFPNENFARTMAESFALTGSQISAVMQEAAMAAFAEDTKTLEYDRHLEMALKNTLEKVNQQYKRPKDLGTNTGMQEATIEPSSPQRYLINSEEHLPTAVPLTSSKLIQSDAEALKEQNYQIPSTAQLSKREALSQLENPPTAVGEIMGKKEAEAYWYEILPEGFSFASKSVPSGLGDYYAISKEVAQWIMKLAVEKADKEGETALSARAYINSAITETEKCLDISSLMRKEYIEEERKRKK